MDPVTVIAAALVAGASAGVSQTATTAIGDAYSGLRNAVRHRLAQRAGGEATAAMDAALADTSDGHEPLVQVLAASGVGEDVSIVVAAQQLLRLTDPGGAARGRYVVDLREARGVQVGDRNVQVNHFS